MKFKFIPQRNGKVLGGFYHPILEFKTKSLARYYAKSMKDDYKIFGCTSVRIELLNDEIL